MIFSLRLTNKIIQSKKKKGSILFEFKIGYFSTLIKHFLIFILGKVSITFLLLCYQISVLFSLTEIDRFHTI